MPSQTFEKEAFLQAAGLFRTKIDHEDQVSEMVAKAISLAGDAAVNLVAVSRATGGEKGPLLTASIAETSVQIRGGNRNILLAPAQGCGNDSRQPKPRFLSCGQILVFCHLTGHDETHLLTAFRVYANGDCTDGEFDWNLSGGSDAFLPYLGHLVQSTIFECDVYWPELRKLPDYLQRIAIVQEEIHEEPLKKPCVGFECSLGPGAS